MVHYRLCNEYVIGVTAYLYHDCMGAGRKWVGLRKWSEGFGRESGGGTLSV